MSPTPVYAPAYHVRAVIETAMKDAYADYQPDGKTITVVFDNTLDTPPDLPFVRCLISYESTNVPMLAQDQAGLERLRGNIQLSCYAERNAGMVVLEQMAFVGAKALNTMWNPQNKQFDFDGSEYRYCP